MLWFRIKISAFSLKDVRINIKQGVLFCLLIYVRETRICENGTGQTFLGRMTVTKFPRPKKKKKIIVQCKNCTLKFNYSKRNIYIYIYPFSLSRNVQTGSVFHAAYCAVGAECSFSTRKAAGAWIWTLTSIKFRGYELLEIYTSTAPICVERETFTLNLHSNVYKIMTLKIKSKADQHLLTPRCRVLL